MSQYVVMMPRPSNLLPLPAPGELRLVQDYLNTRELETGDDQLESPEALSMWLVEHHLAATRAAIDEASWSNALALRASLHALVQSNNRKAKLDGKVIVQLNQVIGDPRPRLRFDTDGEARLTPAESGWAGA